MRVDESPDNLISAFSPGGRDEAADRVLAGDVIAFPTDTVYGLAASLGSPAALARLTQIKERDPAKPLPVLVSATEHLHQVATGYDPELLLLLDELWPGALTIILPARAGLPGEVVALDGTVGVRMPNHPLAIELIEKAGGALAVSSANRSGHIPAVTALEVFAALGNDVDLIVDGGLAPGGQPSTVARILPGEIEIVRDGPVSAAEILAMWSEIKAGG